MKLWSRNKQIIGDVGFKQKFQTKIHVTVPIEWLQKKFATPILATFGWFYVTGCKPNSNRNFLRGSSGSELWSHLLPEQKPGWWICRQACRPNQDNFESPQAETRTAWDKKGLRTYEFGFFLKTVVFERLCSVRECWNVGLGHVLGGQPPVCLMGKLRYKVGG